MRQVSPETALAKGVAVIYAWRQVAPLISFAILTLHRPEALKRLAWQF